MHSVSFVRFRDLSSMFTCIGQFETHFPQLMQALSSTITRERVIFVPGQEQPEAECERCGEDNVAQSADGRRRRAQGIFVRLRSCALRVRRHVIPFCPLQRDRLFTIMTSERTVTKM